MNELKCILIGGASHSGKSTLAKHLAERLGWHCRSTDGLARHPGRPWGVVPAHVVAHYERNSDDEIFAAVLAHQRSLGPAIEALLLEHAGGSRQTGLVLEGSALMPDATALLGRPDMVAFWLTAADATRRQRIESGSGYATATTAQRYLIDRFVERNRRLDAMFREACARLGLPVIDIEGRSVEGLAEASLGLFRP